MANAFRPWIDDVNVSASNVQDGATFVADTQRENGFAAGVPASSIRVNTALREATLVATALVNLLESAGDNFDAQTTLTAMETALGAYFGQSVVGASTSGNNLIINFKNGGSQIIPLPIDNDSLYVVTENDTFNTVFDQWSLSKICILIEYSPGTQEYYALPLSFMDVQNSIMYFCGVFVKDGKVQCANLTLTTSGWSTGSFATLPTGHTFTVKEENAIAISIVAHKTDGSYEFYTSDSFTKVFNNVEYLEFVRYGSGTAGTNKEMCIVDATGGTITNINIATFSVVGSHKYTVYCNDDITLTF